MRGIKIFIRSAIAGSVVVLLLAGCTTKLAPSYDQALVDGITNASPKLLAFFASASSGTKKDDFPQREKTYNELLGSFESLQIQSQARPIPDSAAMKRAGDYIASKYPDLKVSGEIPSAVALGEVMQQLAKMKKNDQSNNMSATKVSLYKGAVVNALDQAITYESFLER